MKIYTSSKIFIYISYVKGYYQKFISATSWVKFPFIRIRLLRIIWVSVKNLLLLSLVKWHLMLIIESMTIQKLITGKLDCYESI